MESLRPSYLSLPQVARQNVPFLEGEVEKLMGQSDSPQILELFLRRVETTGRISINIGLAALVEVLASGAYKNMFELGFSIQEIEARYDRREKYFSKLIAFIELFPEVRSGKYGLLNLGNMGSPWPGFGGGTFCIVLKNSFLNRLDLAERVACLKKFSLAYFDDASGGVSAELYSDVSTHEYLPHLALCKHHHEVMTKKEAWAEMVANRGKLMEIVIFEELGIIEFEEIRCQAQLFDEMEALSSKTGLGLEEYEELEIARWQALKELSERFGVPLVKFG